MNYIRERIGVGESHPWWMGKAYSDYRTYTYIFYVVPLNFIVGWARQVWLVLMCGPHEELMRVVTEAEKQAEYDRGYKDGVKAMDNALRKIVKL